MDSPERSLAAEPSSAYVADTTRDLLEALERLEDWPLLLSSASGSIVHASPNAATCCAMASQPGDDLLVRDGALCCRHADCPRHETFAAAPVPRTGGDLFVVHCADAENAAAAAGIVASAVRADSENVALLDALARSYEERHRLLEELRENEGLRKEIEIARQIQNGLLPQSLPEHPDFDLFAGCVTAHRVGGDYYDVFFVEGAPLGMLIADVSGHNVASGLIAMGFRSSFRQYREQKLDMGVLFESVNRFLHSELNLTGHFLTAAYAELDIGSETLRYVNAGHNPPIVAGRDGEFRTLDDSGLLLGVIPDWRYQSYETTLASGDTFVLYTDGVVEAENQDGERFGVERLQAVIARNRQRSSRELYHHILKELYIFQDEQYNKDDVTMLILKVR